MYLITYQFEPTGTIHSDIFYSDKSAYEKYVYCKEREYLNVSLYKLKPIDFKLQVVELEEQAEAV